VNQLLSLTPFLKGDSRVSILHVYFEERIAASSVQSCERVIVRPSVPYKFVAGAEVITGTVYPPISGPLITGGSY
jgi:hypothetical protein